MITFNLNSQCGYWFAYMSILLRDHSNYQPPELVRVDYLGTRQLASRKLTVMMGILAQYDTRNQKAPKVV